MRYSLLFVLLILGTNLVAQSLTYHVTGTLVEANSNDPIDFASIIIKQRSLDSLITNATTSDGGNFSVRTNSDDIQLEISFIGYKTLVITEFDFQDQNSDLGIIRLELDSEYLDEVLITADKSTLEFKLDKRVFNVGKDLSSTGASVLEVLNNVPSVNVNIEGEVSLRGSTGVQILINGKPSILSDDSSNALGTITADMIEKIEVITNPSAKYEAEGTAGIINIVLKKNEKKGLNGSISLNTGVPHNHSVGLSLNKRTQKFNLFTQLGAGYRELPRFNENTNEDKINGTIVYSEGTEFRNEFFYNLVLGSDYYINPLNVITLSGSYAYEIEDQPSETSFRFNSNSTDESSWIRNEVTKALNPKYQYELQYKKDFEDSKDHQLLFSAIGRFFGKNQASIFTNTATQGQIYLYDQKTETSFKEGKYTFNIDYTKPFEEKWTLEIGSQYLLNDVSNDFEVSDKIGGIYVSNPGLTNTFEYDQKVLGVYGTGSYEDKSWGLKLGLRIEHTDLRTLLVNTNEPNKQTFTDLFPTAHTSFKYSESISFQGGYSRRIYRPRLWDLNPFFNIRNNYSIRAGNPNLRPEYTDSYEAGGIFIFKDISLSTIVYYRLTNDKIERVFFFENNVNTSRPENIGTNRATGLEINTKYNVSKKIILNADANYNIFQRDGQFNDQNFDFSADQWSGKLTGKYKINKNIDLELTGRHQSREKSVQGLIAAYSTLDAGIRIKILKGRGIFNISARDVFASSIQQTTIDNDQNYLFNQGFRGRFLTLGFSYGFGKGEAMQYSGRKRH